MDLSSDVISPLSRPSSASTYELGEHILTIDPHCFELSNKTIVIRLDPDEAYKLLLVLHIHFTA
jgi:hypothetical protein